MLSECSSLDKLVSLRMLVRATAELEDVSAQLKMTDCGPFSTGLVHARLNADIGSVLPIAGEDLCLAALLVAYLA